MDLITALVLGVIEGVTEFLPISSTGHLLLASRFFRLPDSEFVKSFTIIIQLGAILAVAGIYFSKLARNFELIRKVVVGFIPTGLIGLLLYPVIKRYLLESSAIVITSLIVGGIIMIIFERWHVTLSASSIELSEISYKKAAVIGLFQALAIIPGVSRSGATIVGGLALGLSRSAIVEFSFLLAIPTMFAATVLDVISNYQTLLMPQHFAPLLVGFVTSGIVAWLSVKWLLTYVRNHTFITFGVYRIVFGLLMFVLLF